MRSSKNRSRSKGNRNRSVGNIVNRVFDSSGPEGKVRGTPQQIIDKYNQLARDAQLSNDRVAAENFQQHAEHYLRMLAEAQREQDARQPQQGGQPGRERNDGDDRDGGYDANQGYQPQQQQPRGEQPQQQPRGEQPQQPQAQPERSPRPAEREARSDFDAVIDSAPQADSGLVETPESAPKPKRSRTRRPRKTDDAGQPQGDGAEAKGDDSGAGDGPSGSTPQEAAE
jgi:hypothetical protein